METYLNKKSKDNLNLYYQSKFQSSNKSSKNLTNTNNNFSQNTLNKNKSGLFLNNFFRSNNKNNNSKIYNSFKKSSNTINAIKNFKKKKKINVTPYQGIKNEYILNLAMDNLNKYQEDLLLKENIEQNWNDENIKNISNNFENELNNNTDINNINYNSLKLNNNIFNKENTTTRTIYKAQEKFNPINTINNYYKNFFINNDLFNNKETDTEINKNNDISEPESYKYLSSNFRNNMNNRPKNLNKKEINNINFDKNYEKKLNIFINKTFDLKNENEKQNNNDIYNNIKDDDKKLSFILNNLELSELIEVFKKNFIFFDDLFLLSKDDFVEMKIPIGPRNRILNFIEKYKNYGKTYNFEELFTFMKKYKNILINENNGIFNINVTPTTNKKYKSNITTENNKNKKSYDSRGSELYRKELNSSNFEEPTTLSLREEENKLKKNQIKNNKNKKNKIIDDINEIINNAKMNENNSNNQNQNTSKTNEKYKNNLNEENNNNENIFSNSLFNEFGSNNNYNNSNYINNIDNLDITNKNGRNKNISNFIIKNNSIKMENINKATPINNKKLNEISLSKNNINVNNYESQSLNFLNNKENNKAIKPYENFENIFSEIENYQINYEKMKKENNNRNIKINNLLENKNKTNIQNLKNKIKNYKYYNEDDLKNETVRDLKNELEKMNFQKENDNNDLNSIKYNPSMKNYLKPRKNKNNNNPLIEEFNKHK